MTLKTSLGGRDSTSLVTIAEAIVIITDLYPDEIAEWTDLTTSAQEYRLELAVQIMGMMPFAGYQAYCGQALCFPRRIRGSLLCAPADVKVAQVLIAFSVVHRALANAGNVSSSVAAGRVTQISMAGLLTVSMAGTAISGGNLLDKITRSVQFPIYAKLKRYLAQIRGGSVQSLDDDDYPTCSTTTTTSTTSTSSTTSSSSTSSSTTTV